MSRTRVHARFSVGQTIRHRLFDYRGVIADVDPEFLGSRESYSRLAEGKPPRHLPWYHVLVDGMDGWTYVAEGQLCSDSSGTPVDHPDVPLLFDRCRDGSYRSRQRMN